MATKKASQKTTPAAVVSSPVAAAESASAPKKAPAKKTTVVKKPARAAASQPAKPRKAVPRVLETVKPDRMQLEDEIRVEAYSYYIERGYRAGDPMADWHRAEDTVLRRHGLR